MAEMECVSCSALVRSRAEHSTVWAHFRSSVNASARAECVLSTENLTSVNGPSVNLTTPGWLESWEIMLVEETRHKAFLLVELKSLAVRHAAFHWIYSNLSMSCFQRQGSQMMAPYSRSRQTSARFAVCLQAMGRCLRFRQRNSRVQFALFVMVLM